ncbi:MAG: rhomboid family intrarane serine protease [Micrococcaceae bacterium]|jgi:membrane associated rhomboid family serine protease|nr:rhomboid family intrarane serine protease [Micrococcaceae bacterium]
MPDAGTQVPVCPRHPDRISYVRCQRCGRPACSDCQRPAAVGVQCVDCVAEASRSAPTYRSGYGGTVRAGGKPVVTLTLIVMCALAFLLQFLPGLSVETTLWYAPVYTEFQPWRMLTAAFLHSQNFLPHILFNMYALWILGNALEPVLGRARFLALYLISAFGGSVGVLLLSPLGVPVVGASGAIFGLFGALFVVQRQRGGDVRQIVVLIAINAALGFFVAGIAWQAHLGGLLAGGLAAVVLAYVPARARRGLYQWGGLAVVVLLLVVLTVVRAAAIHAEAVQYVL